MKKNRNYFAKNAFKNGKRLKNLNFMLAKKVSTECKIVTIFSKTKTKRGRMTFRQRELCQVKNSADPSGKTLQQS